MPKIRTIRISHYLTPNNGADYSDQKLYRVFLGSGYWIHLQSLKDTKQFLAETNRYLNLVLDQFTSLASDFQTELFYLWRYLSQSEANHYLKQIQELFKTLHLAVDRSGFTNGNVFVFRHLSTVADLLASMAKDLEKKTQPANALNRRLQAVMFKSQLLKHELNQFPYLENFLTKKIKSSIIIKPAMM